MRDSVELRYGNCTIPSFDSAQSWGVWVPDWSFLKFVSWRCGSALRVEHETARQSFCRSYLTYFQSGFRNAVIETHDSGRAHVKSSTRFVRDMSNRVRSMTAFETKVQCTWHLTASLTTLGVQQRSIHSSSLCFITWHPFIFLSYCAYRNVLWTRFVSIQHVHWRCFPFPLLLPPLFSKSVLLHVSSSSWNCWFHYI